MKIEMGESLVRSWFRHSLGCQLAELNWKPSPEATWPQGDAGDLSNLFDEAKPFFNERLGYDFFKKNASWANC